MAVVQVQSLYLSFGRAPVLEGVSFSMEKGERVCLVGRNGTGKSTFLKVISGEVVPESGTVTTPSGTGLAVLMQTVPEATQGLVRDVVAEGLGEIGSALYQYEAIAASGRTDDAAMNELADLQEKLDRADGWSARARVEAVLQTLGVDPELDFASLSGGLKRRVLLARALATKPDVLILDEPTNHLDIDSIAWMEEYLLRFEGALLFVTHDRTFVDRLATRIVELDRGKMTSWPGSYTKYLEGKEKALADEEKANALFDKRLAQEEAWIRQGIKARRTRNEGRVRALEAMRRERRARRERQGDAKLQAQEGETTGKLVLDAKNVSFSWGEKPILKDFTTRVFRGDKIGIIGPNGAGKTTLLRLLLGEIQPHSGTIRQGTNLQVAYFDQLRAQIDGTKTVAENVLPKGDFVTVGEGKRHIIGYLQDFLFEPERARTPAWVLSGGERNRLLLARLFTQPANVLVMDEPTNDLDMETLELVESLVVDFPGTVMVVSHDRAFLDAVCTSTIALDYDGVFREYIGGYSDWVAQRIQPPPTGRGPLTSSQAVAVAGSGEPAKGSAVVATPARKLSWKEKQELDALPMKIEALEQEIAQLTAQMNEPGFYTGSASLISRATEQLAKAESQLEHAYERWVALS